MSAIIVGKGPSAKNIKKSDFPGTYVIAINQACKLVDKPDFVFMNDIDSLKGITPKDIQHAKCFVIPEFPHHNEMACRGITKTDFVHKLNDLKYNGKIETFNLHTGPVKKAGLLTTTTDCKTTGHVAVYYMSKEYGVTHFDTYGFLMRNQDGYHNQQFYDDTNHYTERQIKYIYKHKFDKHEDALNRLNKTLGVSMCRF